MQVQAPSAGGVEKDADPQSAGTAIQDARDTADRMNTLSGPARTVVSTGQNAPAALDTADNIVATYLQPLRIFDTVIGKVAEVGPLFGIRIEPTLFHRYIHMQRWRWACYLVHLKYV